MPIITVSQKKTGVGKSTNLVLMATSLKKPFVIDADSRNYTMSKWHKIRTYNIQQEEDLREIPVITATGQTLVDLAEEKSKQGYTVLIDAPGEENSDSRGALVRCDLILSVVQPSPPELWEIDDFVGMIKRMSRTTNQRRKPICLLFNRVSPHHIVSTQSVDTSRQFITDNDIEIDYIFDSYIKDRNVYKEMFNHGVGVNELTPYNKEAIKETESFIKEFNSVLSNYNNHAQN